jgi:hypothetical protein
MSDNNNKLTPEKLQQIQQLQQMLMQQQKGGAANQQTGVIPPPLKPPRMWTTKGLLIGIIQGMQNSVKFVDQFINLVVKEDGGNANDVVKSAKSPILFGVFVTVFLSCLELFGLPSLLLIVLQLLWVLSLVAPRKK